VQVDSYAYLPANIKHSMISDESTTLVIFERRYSNFIEMLQFVDVVL
jgi:(S)-ureidoglycine aminohydrolase